MDSLSIIILIIVVVGLLWILRNVIGRKAPTRLPMIMAIMSNINDNLKIMASWQAHQLPSKKFRINSWRAYQDKLDFLDPVTGEALRESFTLMTAINEKIDSSIRNPSTKMEQDLSPDRLREPLTRSKRDLSQWIQENITNESRRSRRGWFGW
jgi:hypothetical protein